MARFFISALLLLVASCDAFTASSSSARTVARASTFRLEADKNSGPNFVERGVSVDQDGKSNVWAIEPKVEIESKSSEEKGTAALLAGGGLVVCAAAAAVILTNLPDPNQF